jgi:hypothetical protein
MTQRRLSRNLRELYVVRARRLLTRAAADRDVLYYSDIMSELGGRGYVGEILDVLNREEHATGHPLLSALVITSDTNRASVGFYPLARELRADLRDLDDRQLWQLERNNVWGFDWRAGR